VTIIGAKMQVLQTNHTFFISKRKAHRQLKIDFLITVIIVFAKKVRACNLHNRFEPEDGKV